MTKCTTHIFTFGSGHVSTFPLPGAGTLADYVVKITLSENYHRTHRQIFIDTFTKFYCPHPMQWAMEYELEEFKSQYFKGVLHHITIV